MKNTTRPTPEMIELLFHQRWTVPILGVLWERHGAKVVTLQNVLGTSRDSVKRTLEVLVGRSLVERNPGYGHPMRPEYLLTEYGQTLGPAALRLWAAVQQSGNSEIGLRKWSIPVVLSIASKRARFNDLHASLAGSTPRALALALRDLREVAWIEREVVDADPPRTEYRLTAAGRSILIAASELAAITSAA